MSAPLRHRDLAVTESRGAPPRQLSPAASRPHPKSRARPIRRSWSPARAAIEIALDRSRRLRSIYFGYVVLTEGFAGTYVAPSRASPRLAVAFQVGRHLSDSHAFRRPSIGWRLVSAWTGRVSVRDRGVLLPEGQRPVLARLAVVVLVLGLFVADRVPAVPVTRWCGAGCAKAASTRRTAMVGGGEAGEALIRALAAQATPTSTSSACSTTATTTARPILRRRPASSAPSTISSSSRAARGWTS